MTSPRIRKTPPLYMDILTLVRLILSLSSTVNLCNHTQLGDRIFPYTKRSEMNAI